MKRLLFFLLITTAAVFSQVKDITDYRLVLSDSISNSQTKTFYVDLTNVEAYDSLGFVIAQYGAASIDSVLTYYLGSNKVVPLGTTGSQGLKLNAFGSGANLVLSADQTTTGTNSAYGVITTRLSKATVIPYQTIKGTITAKSSGNTASATAQRVAVYVIFYR